MTISDTLLIFFVIFYIFFAFLCFYIGCKKIKNKFNNIQHKKAMKKKLKLVKGNKYGSKN
jgi:predicted membrane protein